MDTFKVGLIGAGTMAEQYAQAYLGMDRERVRLTAVCDLDGRLAARRAAAWEIPLSCDDYKRILACDDVDAVNIITPNCTHARITIDALEAGKHVLCEKPPALNAREATAMHEAAQKSGKTLMYGFVFRHADKTKLIADWRTKGVFGEIYYAKAGFIRRCGSPGGWFTDRSMSGGGPLLDLGVHLLDLAMYLMGKPQPCSVVGRTFRKLGNRANIKGKSWYKANRADAGPDDVEDMAVALINFANGACLNLEASYASHIKDEAMYLELLGDKAGAVVEPGLEIHGESWDYLTDIKPVLDDYSLFNAKSSIRNELEHFLACAIDGAPCLAPPEDGVTVMKVIDAIYESARLGKLVEIPTSAKRSAKTREDQPDISGGKGHLRPNP